MIVLEDPKSLYFYKSPFKKAGIHVKLGFSSCFILHTVCTKRAKTATYAFKKKCL